MNYTMAKGKRDDRDHDETLDVGRRKEKKRKACDRSPVNHELDLSVLVRELADQESLNQDHDPAHDRQEHSSVLRVVAVDGSQVDRESDFELSHREREQKENQRGYASSPITECRADR